MPGWRSVIAGQRRWARRRSSRRRHKAAPSSFAWDLGDASTGSGGQTFHIYQLAGTYHVTVTASNDTASTQEFLEIDVYDVALAGLTVSNSGPTVLAPPRPSRRRRRRAGPHLLLALWRWGQAGVAPAWHTYAAPGVYTATVTAANGTSNAQSQTAVIVEQALAGVSRCGERAAAKSGRRQLCRTGRGRPGITGSRGNSATN